MRNKLQKYPFINHRRTHIKLLQWQGDGFASVHSRDPGGIRTPNQLIRSQLFYPVELRSHFLSKSNQNSEIN